MLAGWIACCLSCWIISAAPGDVAASPVPSLNGWPAPLGHDLMQFALSFQVEAEEISDDEWMLMMARDLKRHGVLGQIVDQVPPYVINIDYQGDACVHLGNQLVPLQTQNEPVQLNFPTNGSQELFTVMAIDPDVPSRNQSIYSQFLQWLVVNIPQEDMQRGDHLAEYLGPLPSQEGGRHRIVFLAYRQPEPIDVTGLPRARHCDLGVRARFDANQFAQLYRLGAPVAINYFVTEYDPSVSRVIQQCLLQ